jgi:KamA family protein
MVGLSSDETASHIPAMAEYVRSHTEINNVLISGGDAFLNSNEVIEKYLKYFTDIPTLDFIRFGTRIPVVLPQRITGDQGLTDLLKRYSEKKQLIVVTQFNHPRELTPQAKLGIQKLREAGCIVRNQTVLLRGVNDDPTVLSELMNTLIASGVIPYYIFQCRPVAGVHNQFQVPLLRGVALIDRAKSQMNGQSKCLRYAMSHPTGKIEILGTLGERELLFKYHQAKYEKDQARLFTQQVSEDQCWLGDIE